MCAGRRSLGSWAKRAEKNEQARVQMMLDYSELQAELPVDTPGDIIRVMVLDRQAVREGGAPLTRVDAQEERFPYVRQCDYAAVSC